MKRLSVLIISLFLLLYILPLGARPMLVPDEFRYAEIPREMLASGDWIVPHFNGLHYFEKPVLGYWINALAIALLGENAFAVRLPSALAVGCTAWIVFCLVRRFGGGSVAGILGALSLLTCFEVYGIGVFNLLDSMLSLFVTASMGSFLFAHMETMPSQKKGFLALTGLFCGLAFLTKGFIAVAVPAVAILPFVLWEGRWRELFRVLWIPILSAILIALPWCVMIYRREPDFWRYFFWIEHVHRFMSDTPQHPNPPWFFVPVMIFGGLPWIALLPAAIQGLRKKGLRDPLVRFALCWLVFPFLFFSASSGKLATYILPCFPPLVILVTVGLMRYFEESHKRAFNIAAMLLALSAGILGVALLMSQQVGLYGFKLYNQTETWKWILVTGGLLFGAMLLALSAGRKNFRTKATLFSLAPVFFMLTFHFSLPDQIERRKAPGTFLQSYRERVRPDSIIVADEDLVSAICWSYRRNDVNFVERAGEFAYGLAYPGERRRCLGVERLRALIDRQDRENRLIVITRKRISEEYLLGSPQPAFEAIQGRFIFTEF